MSTTVYEQDPPRRQNFLSDDERHCHTALLHKQIS